MGKRYRKQLFIAGGLILFLCIVLGTLVGIRKNIDNYRNSVPFWVPETPLEPSQLDLLRLKYGESHVELAFKTKPKQICPGLLAEVRRVYLKKTKLIIHPHTNTCQEEVTHYQRKQVAFTVHTWWHDYQWYEDEKLGQSREIRPPQTYNHPLPKMTEHQQFIAQQDIARQLRENAARPKPPKGELDD